MTTPQPFPVPNSSGTAPPKLKAPANACDAHHHIYDPARFALPQPQPARPVPPEDASQRHAHLEGVEQPAVGEAEHLAPHRAEAPRGTFRLDEGPRNYVPTIVAVERIGQERFKRLRDQGRVVAMAGDAPDGYLARLSPA